MMTQQCTCFAREPGECACGAWDDVDPALWDDEAPMTQPISPEDALKACPFCGNGPERQEAGVLGNDPWSFIWCEQCDARTGKYLNAAAAAAWNTRTDPPKTVLDEEVVAVLKELCEAADDYWRARPIVTKARALLTRLKA